MFISEIKSEIVGERIDALQLKICYCPILPNIAHNCTYIGLWFVLYYPRIKDKTKMHNERDENEEKKSKRNIEKAK